MYTNKALDTTGGARENEKGMLLGVFEKSEEIVGICQKGRSIRLSLIWEQLLQNSSLSEVDRTHRLLEQSSSQRDGWGYTRNKITRIQVCEPAWRGRYVQL